VDHVTEILLGIGRNHDHDRPPLVKLLGELKPAFGREIYVDQRNAWPQLLRHAEGLGAIASNSQYLDALSPKTFGGGGTEMSIVVDDDATQSFNG
jgi:hypothetical protein